MKSFQSPLSTLEEKQYLEQLKNGSGAGEEIDKRYWKHVSDNGDNVRRNQRNSEAYSIWDRASQLNQRYHRNKKND